MYLVTLIRVIMSNVSFNVHGYYRNTGCSGNGGDSQCRIQSVWLHWTQW